MLRMEGLSFASTMTILNTELEKAYFSKSILLNFWNLKHSFCFVTNYFNIRVSFSIYRYLHHSERVDCAKLCGTHDLIGKCIYLIVSGPNIDMESIANFQSHIGKVGRGKSQSTSTSLQALENFSHPYVKIIFVCKICNKEQSVKLSRTWKQHFMSHNPSNRPHKCMFCEQAFMVPSLLKKHIEKAHQGQQIKFE